MATQASVSIAKHSSIQTIDPSCPSVGVWVTQKIIPGSAPCIAPGSPFIVPGSPSHVPGSPSHVPGVLFVPVQPDWALLGNYAWLRQAALRTSSQWLVLCISSSILSLISIINKTRMIWRMSGSRSEYNHAFQITIARDTNSCTRVRLRTRVVVSVCVLVYSCSRVMLCVSSTFSYFVFCQSIFIYNLIWGT